MDTEESSHSQQSIAAAAAAEAASPPILPDATMRIHEAAGSALADPIMVSAKPTHAHLCQLLQEAVKRQWPTLLHESVLFDTTQCIEVVAGETWWRISLSAESNRCLYNAGALAYGVSPEQLHASIVAAVREAFLPSVRNRHETLLYRAIDNIVKDTVKGPDNADVKDKQALASAALTALNIAPSAEDALNNARTAVLDFVETHWTANMYGSDAFVQLLACRQGVQRVEFNQWNGEDKSLITWTFKASKNDVVQPAQAAIFVHRQNENHFWLLFRRCVSGGVQFRFNVAEANLYKQEIPHRNGSPNCMGSSSSISNSSSSSSTSSSSSSSSRSSSSAGMDRCLPRQAKERMSKDTDEPQSVTPTLQKQPTASTDMESSTQLWKDKHYSELRRRLESDGYLFIRGVLDVEAVKHARCQFFDSLLKLLCQKRATADQPTAYAPKGKSQARSRMWDARTGVSGDQEDKDARILGCGDAMTALYMDSMQEFMAKLCSSQEASAAAPSFRLLSDCTWMRAVLTGGKTSMHADIGYFLRRTDRVVDFYKKQPPTARSDGGCAQGMCQLDAQLYACACCGRSYHRACGQTSLLAWLGDKSLSKYMHRWHCDECLNAPSPFYTCWMPLTDLTPKSSRLQLIPGSHKKQGYDRMQPAGDGDELPGECTSDDAASSQWITVPADMKAGDLVLFNWKLTHAASIHKDAQLRMSLDTRICITELDSPAQQPDSRQ